MSIAPAWTRQLVVIPVPPGLARSAPALLVASSFPQPCSGQWVLLLLSSGQLVLPLLYLGRLFSFDVFLEASSLATALLGWLLSSRPSWDDSVFQSLPCRGSFCPFPTQGAWIYSCPAPVALHAPCPNPGRLALLLPRLRHLVSSLSCSGLLSVPLAPHGVSRFAPAPLRADSVARP